MAKAKAKGPDSEHLVAESRLRDLVEHLREAGPAGATKEALQAALGVRVTRTVDRGLALLEKQGALLERGWTHVGSEDGARRVMTVALLRGPKWDESVSASARLALGVLLGALRGGLASAWTEHLGMVEQLVEGKLTTRDRKLLEEYAPQLGWYARVLATALKKPLRAAFVHLPIRGEMAEVEDDVAAQDTATPVLTPA